MFEHLNKNIRAVFAKAYRQDDINFKRRVKRGLRNLDSAQKQVNLYKDLYNDLQDPILKEEVEGHLKNAEQVLTKAEMHIINTVNRYET